MYNELVELFEEYAEMEVDKQENILDLDLDSLILIDLRNTIEMRYHVDLKLNQMLNMTVEDAIQYVIEQSDSEEKEGVENTLIKTSQWKEFPLNDLQKAYWVGRSGEYELGNVSTHVYVEFENKDLDFEKFVLAVNKLVERHEMLRAVILSNGMQKILPVEEAKYEIPYRDLTKMNEKAKQALLENERRRMSHQVFEIDSCPFFEVQVFRLKDELYRIYVSIDMLIADACSLSIFFRDLNYFYNGRDGELKPIDFQFRDYIVNDSLTDTSEKYMEADRYWEEKCKKLALAPKFPLQKQPSEITKPKFKHAQRIIKKEDYEKLKTNAKGKNVTMPSLLLAVYIEILSAWTNDKRFSVNVTNLDRKKYSDSVNDLIGQFASFTIFSSEARGEKDFYEYATDIQKELWEDLDHRYIGGTRILQKLRMNSGNMGNALMPIVFTCILEDTSQTDWLGDIVYSISQTSQIWLDNQTLEQDGELVLSWDYLEELFPSNMVEQMLQAYAEYIIALARGEEPKRVPESLLESRRSVNKTEDENMLQSVSELLENSFKMYPNNVCIVGEEGEFTYREVEKLMDLVAGYILESRKNHPVVAVIMEKSYKQIVTALGIVKAGGTYLPIDASLPLGRIQYMLEDSQVYLVITDSSQYDELGDVYQLEKFSNIRKRKEKKQEFVKVSKEDSMYVVYTSGSTGKPSGVIVGQEGVGNALLYTNKTYQITSQDAVIAMTPFHHDMSVFDIFGMLIAGGKIVVPSEQVRKNPAALADLMLEQQVTIWNSVPALMDVFCEYISSKTHKIPVFLRLVFLGGDWISPKMCGKLFELLQGLTIVSVGGPTETTLWNISYAFDKVDETWARIPYGKPISNTKYYILDDKGEEVPDWVLGNICSTGVGVAKGYCNNPEKTAEKFVEHPNTKERMCVSGDLGRYTEDGNIEIFGRKDHQIKINGVRIEIEEIEAVIKQYAPVKRCVVACHEKNNKLLLAYVEVDANTYSENELQEHMRKQLPNYMIPKQVMVVDEIPYTANFKLDRKKLMALAENVVEKKKTKTQGNANTDNMQLIGNIVKEVLELEQIDPDENISLLGGSSIELIKIINRLEKVYNHRMALEDFFENLTIRKLAIYFGEKEVTKNQEQENSGSSDSEWENIINGYEVLFDRNQREMFKLSNQGLRRDLNDRKAIPLGRVEMTPERLEQFKKRRSYRNYDGKQVSWKNFSELLSWVANLDDKQYPNFMYASGGGLYSVQVYIYVMAGGVEGLEQGFYYYDRNSHLLRVLKQGVDIKKEIHWSSNQAIYADSAFSIYLVADYDAVGPMYGNQGVHFMTIEAGLLSEVLEMKASDYSIGLCQIGNMDFDKIKEYLELKSTHIFMHTLIGGYVDYTRDYESKQQTREYLKTSYTERDKKNNAVEKDFIQAVNVQDLKCFLEEGEE